MKKGITVTLRGIGFAVQAVGYRLEVHGHPCILHRPVLAEQQTKTDWDVSCAVSGTRMTRHTHTTQRAAISQAEARTRTAALDRGVSPAEILGVLSKEALAVYGAGPGDQA